MLKYNTQFISFCLKKLISFVSHSSTVNTQILIFSTTLAVVVVVCYPVNLLDIREKIRNNATEKFQIIHQKLGHIHVSDGSQGYQFLGRSTRSYLLSV